MTAHAHLKEQSTTINKQDETTTGLREQDWDRDLHLALVWRGEFPPIHSELESIAQDIGSTLEPHSSQNHGDRKICASNPIGAMGLHMYERIITYIPERWA
jgi:hypothetical protein